MATPRFFVDLPLAVGATVRLPEAVAHHARRVLRLRGGDAIVLFDGRGGEYRAVLGDGADPALAHVEAFDPVERESPLAMTLVQALVAADRLDWIVEKAVELGAARILIAATERSVARLDAPRAERRLRHWRALAVAACAQCGRNRLPDVAYFASLPAALDAVADTPSRLLLMPTAPQPLPAARPAGAVALVVGPEGGFSVTETQYAERVGVIATRLGPRILRTETAGLAALAALQALAGDLAD